MCVDVYMCVHPPTHPPFPTINMDFNQPTNQKSPTGLAAVEAKVPQRLKKKRMVTGEGGEELGWEEYYDYHFPDDQVGGGVLCCVSCI